VWGMKAILLILAVVVVGCASTSIFDPNNKNHVVIEKKIRHIIDKPEGELTRADFEKVTRFSLAGNRQITDISPLRTLTKLNYLNISEMSLTDDQLKHLSELTNLELLALDDNPDLTGTNLNELTKLKKLRNLYLQHTKVTEADVAQLQKALPKCDIRWR